MSARGRRQVDIGDTLADATEPRAILRCNAAARECSGTRTVHLQYREPGENVFDIVRRASERVRQARQSGRQGSQAGRQAGVPDGYGNHRTCFQAAETTKRAQTNLALDHRPFIASVSRRKVLPRIRSSHLGSDLLRVLGSTRTLTFACAFDP